MSETDRGAETGGGDYFSTIEAEFIRRRGTPFLLSTKDFALMKRWKELEIPVEDVVAGIHDAFDRREERQAAGRVNSLSYCEGAVLEAWEKGAAARVGKGGGAVAGEAVPVAARLRDLEGLLRAFGERQARFRPAAEKALDSLERLGNSPKSAEQVEESLARVEKKLLKAIAALLPPGEAAAVEREVSRRLAPEAESMEAGALRRTAEILRRRKLRELCEVPSLTLLGR